MLARARRPAEGVGFVEGDVRALPLADGSFDLVWCRLVMGFVEEMDAVYRELARVTRPDGTLVVTDLHPRSAGAGHVRSFRDGGGVLRSVAHHLHLPEAQTDAARRAGLGLRERLDLEVGPSVRAVFEGHDALGSYEQLRGLPVVLGLRFQKTS
jgi:malonyl-CoA O-methyltransferase